MAEWKLSGNAAALADQGGKGMTSGEVREGTYTWQVESFKDEKTMAGDDKFSVGLKIVAQDDGGQDMIGIARTQHFVVGHKKETVAAGYRADCLALLKAAGVTDEQLNACNDSDDVFMLGRKLAKDGAKVRYWVRPQAKDPKYLDWKLAVAASGPTESPAIPAATAEKDDLFA